MLGDNSLTTTISTRSLFSVINFHGWLVCVVDQVRWFPVNGIHFIEFSWVKFALKVFENQMSSDSSQYLPPTPHPPPLSPRYKSMLTCPHNLGLTIPCNRRCTCGPFKKRETLFPRFSESSRERANGLTKRAAGESVSTTFPCFL